MPVLGANEEKSRGRTLCPNSSEILLRMKPDTSQGSESPPGAIAQGRKGTAQGKFPGSGGRLYVPSQLPSGSPAQLTFGSINDQATQGATYAGWYHGTGDLCVSGSDDPRERCHNSVGHSERFLDHGGLQTSNEHLGFRVRLKTRYSALTRYGSFSKAS